jgi:transcription elongation factor/antiterminator RfaH
MSSFVFGPRELVGNERWYLVACRHRAERKADYHLKAQEFATFLPLFLKSVRHARQLRTVAAPLFLGYLFIILDLRRDRWLSVRSTVGVSQLVADRNGHPMPVPFGVVETLIRHADDGLMRLDTGLREGQTVRILSGPFANLIGSLERLEASGRVQVLLKMMGSSVPVLLQRSVLSPAA